MLDLFRHERKKFGKLSRVRRQRTLAFAALSISGGAAFIVFLGWLSFHSLVIKHIYIEGNAHISSAAITAETNKILADTHLGIFSKRNAILLPDRALERSLLEHIPALQAVDVRKDYAGSLTLTVIEREPYAVWCQSQTVKPCYFLDSDGLIFAPAPDFSGNPYFRFIGGLSTTSSVVGDRLFTQQRFKALSFFLQSLRSLELRPAALVVEEGEVQTSLHLSLENGAVFILSDEQSFESTLDNIVTLLTDPEIGNREEFLARVDRIDFRFGNKIYYTER